MAAGRLRRGGAELGSDGAGGRQLDARRAGADDAGAAPLGHRIGAEQRGEQPRGGRRVGRRDDDAGDGAGAVWMRLPFRPPHQLRRRMLAEIHAAHRDLAGIEAGCAKACILAHPVELDRTRERLHRQDRQPGRRGVGVHGIGVFGLEHEAVEPDRERRQLGPVAAGAGAEAEQLKIIGREHREMVHRAERVVAARRQPKAEAREDRLRLVHAVAHIDHDMVKHGRRQRHWDPPPRAKCHCEGGDAISGERREGFVASPLQLTWFRCRGNSVCASRERRRRPRGNRRSCAAGRSIGPRSRWRGTGSHPRCR